MFMLYIFVLVSFSFAIIWVLYRISEDLRTIRGELKNIGWQLMLIGEDQENGYSAKVEDQEKCSHPNVIEHYIEGSCGDCGETVYDHTNYCSYCGSKLDWDDNK